MISRKTAEDLWIGLARAYDAALQGGPESTETMQLASSFHGRLGHALAQEAGAPVRLRMRMSLFVHEHRALSDASIRGRALIALLRRLDAGGFEFGPDVAPAAVVQLLRVGCEAVRAGHMVDPGQAIRRIAAIPGLRLLEPQDDVRWQFLQDPATSEAYTQAGLDVEAAAPLRQEMAAVVEDAVVAAGDGDEVDLNVARSTAEHMLDAGHAGFDNIMQLAERPEFDVFTVQHSLRVSLFATYVAGRLGAPKEFLVELGAAAMFHDVGKGRIPDEVLYKPGRLDDDERRVMSMHPELGASILLESQDTSPCALGAAWGHHLRFDGAGYPDRRPWHRTTRATSLIQICDVFEALTARRPYKAPYSPARAFQILYSDPGAFDPTLLAAFTRALGLYPPGRFVLLSDGRLGRVSRAGRALDRPVVRTFPKGDTVVLGAPENAALSVERLLEEPEFVQLLMTGVSDAAKVAPDLDLGALGPEVESDPDAPDDARDEEFASLGPRRGSLLPTDGCGHGSDCRLC